MFQAMSRSGLATAATLLLVLTGSSLHAGTLPALGSLQASGTVYVGQSPVPESITVYSGDRVLTQDGQAVVSLHRTGVLVLGRGSAALLGGSPSGPSLGLEKGQLMFTLASPPSAQIESEGIVFRSVGSFPSMGQLALAGNGTILLAVQKGTVEVANLRREPVRVKAGETLTIDPRSRDGQGQTVGTGAHGHATLGDKLRTFRIGGLSHTASAVLVVGGLGGLAATGVYFATNKNVTPISPSAP